MEKIIHSKRKGKKTPVFVQSEPHTPHQIFQIIYNYILYTPNLSAQRVQLHKCAHALPELITF